MLIGFIAPYPPKQCGIAEYTYFLTNAIKSIQKDVEILVFAENYTQEATGITVFESFKRAWENNGKVDYDNILKDIKEHGPFDVIHIQLANGIFPYDKNLVEFLKKLRNHTRGLVVTFHEVFRGEDKKRMEIQKQIIEIVDFAIVHTPLQEFELHNQLRWEHTDKIIWVPHGTRIFSTVSRKEALSLLSIDGFDIPDDYKVIGIVGRITKAKGIDLLIDAVKKLLKEIPNLYLVIAGMTPPEEKEYFMFLYNKVKEEIPKNGIIINRWLSRTELNLFISLSDIIALPYRDPWDHYSVSGVFHYVIGSGKPIICSKANRLIECYLIAPELTFLPNNLIDLVNKLVDLLNDNVNLDKIKKFAQDTSWENIAKKHLLLYSYLEKTPEGQEKIRKEFLNKIQPNGILDMRNNDPSKI